MHDSVAFYGAFDKFLSKVGIEKTKYFAGDATYITPHICKLLIDLELIPCLPYKKPMKKRILKKYKANIIMLN